MHVLNPYHDRKPDFAQLASRYPALAVLSEKNASGKTWIDFQSPAALRALTTALLKEDFNLTVELRGDRLCPTTTRLRQILFSNFLVSRYQIANRYALRWDGTRLDYLLHVLDFIPFLGHGPDLAPKAIDIGTGHVVIYPLLLHRLRPQFHIVATETDEASLNHAEQTLRDNAIDGDRIQLVRANESGRILGPLFVAKESGREASPYSFTICNPPFFGSMEEASERAALKSAPPSSAPTAALNELVTRGGEVAFIGQMIDESLLISEQCLMFTSLVGKYASLQPLVDQLRQHKVDNYFVKSIRQAKTTRWIIGWSFGAFRLPDSLTRPELVVSHTSFAKLLSLPNTFTHRLDATLQGSDLKDKVLAVLGDVGLSDLSNAPPTASADEQVRIDGEEWAMDLAPRKNTWSRSARRAAARATGAGGQEQANELDTQKPADVDPLFRATLRFVYTKPTLVRGPATVEDPTDVGPLDIDQAELPEVNDDEEEIAVNVLQEEVAGLNGVDKDGRRRELHMDWTWGTDRALVDSLWKYLLTKTELDDRHHRGQGRGEGGGHADGGRVTGAGIGGSQEFGTGRGAGGRGRGRERGRERGGRGGIGLDQGWKRRGPGDVSESSGADQGWKRSRHQ